MSIRAIITDIEGTTSDIAFVHKVLFPYAAERLPAYVREHADDPQVRDILAEVRKHIGQPDASDEDVIEILLRWIETDQKVTPLKTLQGLIWREGYERGDFTGHVYDDAAQKLRDWHESGIALYVYSSGSEAAQRLLFGYSDAGDLTPLFSGHFDTRIGGKKEADSYVTIVEELAVPAREILFLSDVEAELEAAAAAGLSTCLLARDETCPDRIYPVARDFHEVAAEFDLH